MPASQADETARTDGPFTRAAAIRAGHTPADVRRHLRTGRWVALRQGIYVEGLLHRFCAGDDGRLHSLHAAGALLSVSRPAWVSGLSAAVLHSAALLTPLPRPVELSIEPTGSAGTVRGVDLVVRRTSLPPTIARQRGRCPSHRRPGRSPTCRVG